MLSIIDQSSVWPVGRTPSVDCVTVNQSGVGRVPARLTKKSIISLSLMIRADRNHPEDSRN